MVAGTIAVMDGSGDVRATTAESVQAVADQRERERAAVLAARTIAPQAARDELATFLTVEPYQASVADMYARLIAVAQERVALYGRLLAAAYEESGVDALRGVVHIVDPETGVLVPNAEKPTGLVVLEMRERDALERLIVQGARLGLEQRAQEALARSGAVLVAAMRDLAEGLGRDWTDPAVRRLAQKALLAARASADRQDRDEAPRTR